MRKNRVRDCEYWTWLTKQQAADAIGVSTKTVERLARKGDLRQRLHRNLLTGAKLVVYLLADVSQIPRRPGCVSRLLADPRVTPGPDVERRFRERQFLHNRCRRRTAGLVKRGVLIPERCERCGAATVQAHHDDYADPERVRWLCHLCHHKWHRDLRLSARREASLPRGTSPTAPSPTGGDR